MSKVIQDSEADQAGIDAEAADWLVRQDDGSLTQEERATFEAWMASDSRRARTFAAMSRTWGEAADLKHLAHLAEARPPELAGNALRFMTPPRFGLRSARSRRLRWPYSLSSARSHWNFWEVTRLALVRHES